MSSLTEQERIGLEEVFLSISSSRNLSEKWDFWRHNFSTFFKAAKGKSAVISPSRTNFWTKIPLKPHKITKLFIKIQKRRKI